MLLTEKQAQENRRKQEKTSGTPHRGTLNLNGSKGIAGPGRPAMTPEKRLMKKIEKDAYSAYCMKLERLLDEHIVEVYEAVLMGLNSPQGVMAAIRVCELIENRLYGKPAQRVQLQKVEPDIPGLVDLTEYRTASQMDNNQNDLENLEKRGGYQ